MPPNITKQIEEIFRNSDSPEELFDAFHLAKKNELKDYELYKILLANPALTLDEVKMYTNELIHIFPNQSFNFTMWAAEILETNFDKPDYLEEALNYYRNAIEIDCTQSKPLLKLLENYNYDLPYSQNKTIIEIINRSLPKVKSKKELYCVLAKHYKRSGEISLSRKYMMLAEKSVE